MAGIRLEQMELNLICEVLVFIEALNYRLREQRLLTSIFACRFRSPLRKNYVDYKRFCDAVEEVFQQPNLERAPLIVPLQHIPSYDDSNNFLNFDERQIVSAALNKLAKYPDQVSNLSSLFEVLLTIFVCSYNIISVLFTGF